MTKQTPHTGTETAITNTPPEKRLLFGLSLLHWLYLFSFWAATGLTWVVSQNIQQFDEQGPVAFEKGFPGDLQMWSRQGGWDNLLFEPNAIIVKRIVENSSYAYRTFPLDSSNKRDLEKLVVTGNVKTLTKKTDDDISDGAALMVWLQNDTDEVVTYLNIGKFDGQEDGYEVSRTISLTEGITKFSLVLTNKESSAEFSLENASVNLITEKPLFGQIRILVFLVWAIIFAIALVYVFKRASAGMFILIASVIALTIAGVLMPETLSSDTIKPLYAKLQSATGITGDTLLEQAYKLGHFVFFFLFTLILLMYRKPLQLPIWEILMLVILFAVATEGLQLYLSDRTSRISDLLIDFSAVLVAAMIAVMIVSLKPAAPITEAQ